MNTRELIQIHNRGLRRKQRFLGYALAVLALLAWALALAIAFEVI